VERPRARLRGARERPGGGRGALMERLLRLFIEPVAQAQAA